jgi:hypothetical protein
MLTVNELKAVLKVRSQAGQTDNWENCFTEVWRPKRYVTEEIINTSKKAPPARMANASRGCIPKLSLPSSSQLSWTQVPLALSPPHLRKQCLKRQAARIVIMYEIHLFQFQKRLEGNV